MAHSRQNIRRMIKDRFILRKPTVIHSRARVNKRAEAKKLGRHTGPGKRKGTREARLPTKVIWMRRLRVLRRMLKRYREQRKIDKHLYQALYMQIKGNKHKSKKQLMEVIHHEKDERRRAKALADQAELAKAKAQRRREKRAKKKDDDLARAIAASKQ